MLSVSLAALMSVAMSASSTKAEEYLWRDGSWYCAHYSVSGVSVGSQRGRPHSDIRTLTVHRSGIAEGSILISSRGTIAELPRLFAAYVQRRYPALGSVRQGDVKCYYFAAKRNILAQVERQSGLGARRLVNRGERLATVTEVIALPDFAGPVMQMLRSWVPPAGQSIYPAPTDRRPGAVTEAD